MCLICTDSRQFIPVGGQRWTTLGDLCQTHRNAYRSYESGLLGIGTTPDFAIGQRALLVRSPSGNVLWDCIAMIDAATIEIVRAMGGLSAIAISHPHYYTTMVEWSRAFGGIPIYLHVDDRQWVMQPDPAIVFWDGETRELARGLTLIRCGGHFSGATVLHWSDGADGKGAVLSGDVIQVVADTRWVSFMFSYPNLVPLPAQSVQRISRSLRPYAFDRIYGAFWDRFVARDARAALERSAERYVAALESEDV